MCLEELMCTCVLRSLRSSCVYMSVYTGVCVSLCLCVHLCVCVSVSVSALVPVPMCVPMSVYAYVRGPACLRLRVCARQIYMWNLTKTTMIRWTWTSLPRWSMPSTPPRMTRLSWKCTLPVWTSLVSIGQSLYLIIHYHIIWNSRVSDYLAVFFRSDNVLGWYAICLDCSNSTVL